MSAILVVVSSFGSVWRWRLGKNQEEPYRFGRGAYFNTTGVQVGSEIRQRPKVSGYARFNGRSGFDPSRLTRMIDRVFECAEPCVWQGANKLLFIRTLSTPSKPDRFLVVLQNAMHGTLKVGSQNWRSADTWLISFSEYRDQQEAMLLMPMHSWIDTEIGRFVLVPLAHRPWSARLLLASAT
ncbi:MAG TPA: hypothetical protein VJQ82_12210 [Terriglobales bacterium]|nr:hypothetical protein [Terriglobales bacterium]